MIKFFISAMLYATSFCATALAYYPGLGETVRYYEGPAQASLENLSPDDWHGSNRQDILDAQRELGLKRTGVMNAATKNAVRKYQRSHKLPVTGWLDTSTMELLTNHDFEDSEDPRKLDRASDSLEGL